MALFLLGTVVGAQFLLKSAVLFRKQRSNWPSYRVTSQAYMSIHTCVRVPYPP